jgi:hypothetical protein
MAPGSTEPLTEMSTRNLPRDKGRPAREADNLTAICGPIVYKIGEPRRPVTGIALPFYFLFTFYSLGFLIVFSFFFQVRMETPMYYFHVKKRRTCFFTT